MVKEKLREYTTYFLSFLQQEKREVFVIYVYSAFSALVYLSLPLGIQAIVSYAMGGRITSSIYVIISFVVLGTWIVGYLRVQVMNIIEKIQQKIFVEYGIKYAEKFSKLDLSKLNKYYLPELVNRIFDAANLQKSISKILLDIPIATIRIVVGIILLGFYHPLFIAFGAFVFALLIIIYKYNVYRGLYTSIKESDKKYEVAYWLETIGLSINSIKPYSQYNLHLKKVDTKLNEYIEYRTKHFKILTFQYKTIVVFKVVTTLVMLVLSSYLLINQKINIGAFVAAELVIMTIITSVEKIITSLESYYDVITALVKLNKVIDLPEEESGELSFPKRNEGVKIECSNVNFSFSDETPILKNINLKISPNTITVVSGKMASGKSTFVKILAGFYQPKSGNILFDEIPSQNIIKKELNAAIGFYTDDLKVFAGTIFENIQVGNPKIEVDDIATLSNQLGISNVFQGFPKSYYTYINENQTQLAYSIKKSILLLKTFLGDHRVLILEEPLQGMNETFTKNVIEHFKQISKNKNLIIVTEDEAVINIADHHYCMENGELKTIK